MYQISNPSNFLLVEYDGSHHQILTCGTLENEDKFKEMLYHFFNECMDMYPNFSFLEKLDNCTQFMYMVEVKKISLPCHMNLSAWTVENYSTLSKQLFDYYTQLQGNDSWKWIDFQHL